jgi:hypothetical protein
LNGRVLALVAGTAVLSFLAYRLRSRLSRPRALGEPRLPEPATDSERLARLLVTEIKLYHLQEIETIARRGVEPSPELRAEIVASRATYRERIPAAERGDHFEAAVLGILAFGDKAVSASLLSSGS